MKFFKKIDDTSLHLIFLGVIAVVAIASLSWLSLSLGQADDFLSVGQAVSMQIRVGPPKEYTDCKNDCSTTNEKINNQNNANSYNKELCPKDCNKRNENIKKQNDDIISCQKNCDNNAPPITGRAVARSNRIPTPQEIQECKTSCVTNKQTQCQEQCGQKRVREQFKSSITGMFAQITGNAMSQEKVTKLKGLSLDNCKKDCMTDPKIPMPAINCEQECSANKYPIQKLTDCKQKCAQYCTPETDNSICSRLRKDCGTITTHDNCGDIRQRIPCGNCLSGQICEQNKCVMPQATTVSQPSTQSSTQSSLVAGTTDNVISPTPGTAQNLATQIANIGNKNANTGSTQIAAPINVPQVPIVQPQCVVGEKKCGTDGRRLTCNVNTKTWDAVWCTRELSCINGDCGCIVGTTKCMGNSVIRCDSPTQYNIIVSDCPNPTVCMYGRCDYPDSVCNAGQTKCSSVKNEIEVCNSERIWTTLAACNPDQYCNIDPTTHSSACMLRPDPEVRIR